MIVVLDSGIWISAFQFGGTPQAALDSVFSAHTVAICDQIVAEISATLVRKFSWTDEEILSVLTEYTNEATHVDVNGTLRGVCRDSKDDMVFECAAKSHAEIIISGDNDLLSVKPTTVLRFLPLGNTSIALPRGHCDVGCSGAGEQKRKRLFLPLLRRSAREFSELLQLRGVPHTSRSIPIDSW